MKTADEEVNMKPWLMVAALGLAGCQGPAAVSPGGVQTVTQLAFTQIEAGGFSLMAQQGGHVLRSGSDWQKHVIDAKGADTKAPDVDFDKEMVVAVYAGEKPSGGYTVAVQQIERHVSEIVVRAKVTAPGSDLGTITVLTYPYQWVKLAQSDLPVRFVFE